jgi:hypothetical protein
MTNIDWKAWTLEDWNHALVQEVFFNSGEADIPITRINASDRLLAKCIGGDVNYEEVRNHFIACFGPGPKSVRANFVMRAIYKHKTKRDDIPPVFANLFLTLLAGSADANSIDIGQFRLRFSELFKAFHVGELPFDDLPKFWNLIAEWSVDRNNRLGDCRVLQLTYKGRETLIGNSKKLAFPAYADERLLNLILDPDNLDFGQVERAIHRNLKGFTDQFKEEFNDFFSCYYRSDLKGAFETPLWGVVQDLSLESQRFLASNYGSYSVEIFISQQQEPEFYLSTNEHGYNLLKDSYQIREVFNKDGGTYLVDLTKEKGLVDTLNDMALKYPDLKKMKLWKQLKNNFVPFFPDEGYLTTKGIFSDGDQCSFLMKNSLYEKLKQKNSIFSKKPNLIKLGNLCPDWYILYFEKLQYKELQDFLPEDLRRVIGVSWRPAQISLRDAAKHGQAYLINPCSNPRFESSKFSSGRYEIGFYNNREPIIGILEKQDDFLRIPPLDISVDLKEISKIKYEAIQLIGSGKTTKVISALNRTPVLDSYDFSYSEKWVVPGRSGLLIPYRDFFKFDSQDTLIGNRVTEFIKPFFLLSPDVEPAISANATKLAPNSTPNYLRWILESLSLRFQSRSSLSYGELVTYTKDIANILGVKHSRLRNLMFLGGWLLGMQDRNYQGFASHLSPRTISVLKREGLFNCRITGIFNEAEEYKFLHMLNSDESFHRICDPKNTLSIGAIEISVVDMDKVAQFIDCFNLILLDEKSYGIPLHSKGLSLSEAPLSSLPNKGNLSIFRGVEWVDYEISPKINKGTIIRHKEASKYWVFDGKYYLQADNQLAIVLMQCVVNGTPLGSISSGGECIFNSNIFSLPDSFTRWWLHWGGGCISYSDKGEIIFAGSPGLSQWDVLESWISGSKFSLSQEQANLAMVRRELALNKLLGQKNRVTYVSKAQYKN